MGTTLTMGTKVPADLFERMTANAGLRSRHRSPRATCAAEPGAAPMPPVGAAPKLCALADRVNALAAEVARTDARRPHTHDLEAEAQAIARELVAAFRGNRT